MFRSAAFFPREHGIFSLAMRMAIGMGLFVTLLLLFLPSAVAPWLQSVADFLGFPGNDIFLVAGNLLIIGWGWRQRRKYAIFLALWSDLVVGIVVQGTKFLLRTEPWHLRPDGGYGGFPSGHATHAFVMAMLLTVFFPRLRWLWFILAGAIAWSRVVTNWHTSLQVIAGVILGIILGCLFLKQWLRNLEGQSFKFSFQQTGKQFTRQPGNIIARLARF